ncbi:MAG TPA: efflux RND transporter periplasmic adaptor subunit [Thermoanaerobaculia bacterium]|nr:efflux RND transporter periplasmic adaptor subunit [Thermoanaerobaculia bacterium]
MKHATLFLPGWRRRSAVALLVATTALGACAGDSPRPGDESAAAARQGDGMLRLPEQRYPDGVRQALTTALAAYEEARAELAADRLETVRPRASRLAAALGMAQDAGGDLDPTVLQVLAETARAASSLAAAGDLETARAAFAEVSRFVVPLVGADSELAAEWHVFECPMEAESGFAKWVQAATEPANPYMGPEMLACATRTDWTAPAPASLSQLESHVEHAHGGDPDAIAYYTCAMHPSVKSPDPGKCPICSMELTPVTHGELASGVVIVDAARRQRIGVRVETVSLQTVTVPVRAVGKVTFDETRLADVTVKYQGWIRQLFVNQTGQAVRRGQPLFTLYSPDLYAAQQEYLTALASQRTARATSVPDRADYLVAASRQRLRLWDLSPAQIDRLAETGEALEQIPIFSPASGFVVEKEVVEGSAVSPGMKLFRIAGLDRVWIEAEVYESELGMIQLGDRAEVGFPYMPGQAFSGRVTFVYPYLDPMTRTGRVRIEVANPQLAIKPDMFANVTLYQERGERLVVPEEAILYAGERRFVFLDLGEGRLRPQQVEVGPRVGELVEVLAGLAPGDRIVTSGNFLIAAESRLKLAMDQWGGAREGSDPPRPPAPAGHQGH